MAKSNHPYNAEFHKTVLGMSFGTQLQSYSTPNAQCTQATVNFVFGYETKVDVAATCNSSNLNLINFKTHGFMWLIWVLFANTITSPFVNVYPQNIVANADPLIDINLDGRMLTVFNKMTADRIQRKNAKLLHSRPIHKA